MSHVIDYLVDLSMNFRYGPRRENKFWTGHGLVRKDSLEECIAKLIDELEKLEIRDEGRIDEVEMRNQGRINGVYLFGPFLDLKGEKTYRKEPKYIDLYFWTESSNSDLADIIKKMAESWQIGGLNIKAWVRPSRPFDCTKPKIISHFTLYEHPKIEETARKKGGTPNILSDYCRNSGK